MNLFSIIDEQTVQLTPRDSYIQNAQKMRTFFDFQEIWQYRTQSRAVVEYFSIAGRFPAVEDILCQTPPPLNPPSPCLTTLRVPTPCWEVK